MLQRTVVKIKGKRVLVTICEDIWAWPHSLNQGRSNYIANPLKKLNAKDVDIVVNLSASPFTATKLRSRTEVVTATAKHFKAPMIYVNMVGAQDEIIFDGHSFAVSSAGKTLAQSCGFKEDLNVLDLTTQTGGMSLMNKKPVTLQRKALTTGIKDFVDKTHLQRVHLGLSGGIDSALVACLAVEALGPSKVTAIMMPGPFSQPTSEALAIQLCNNLGIEYKSLPITPAYEQFCEQLKSCFTEFPFGSVNENLQARLRGTALMAFSNLYSSLLLNTSNKSEFATGYSTLYGDMTGGAMSHWRFTQNRSVCPISSLQYRKRTHSSGHSRPCSQCRVTPQSKGREQPAPL